MLEIFALPYMAISGVIGWLIFEPFFRSVDTDSLAPSRLTTTDLLAIPLPVSVIFLVARWLMPESIDSPYVQAIVVSLASLFTAAALTLGLYLMPKTFPMAFFKRMSLVGIIAPFGILLTIGWIGFLIWACAYSVLYLVPSTIAVAATTTALRMLGLWVCQPESAVAESAVNP